MRTLAVVAVASLALTVSSVDAANIVVNGDFSSNAAAFITYPGYLANPNNPEPKRYGASGSGNRCHLSIAHAQTPATSERYRTTPTPTPNLQLRLPYDLP